jgi:hypothetical protein
VIPDDVQDLVSRTCPGSRVEPVKGFTGYYVTDCGRVFSTKGPEPREMKQHLDHYGYPAVALRNRKQFGLAQARLKWGKVWRVHRLVAFAFCGLGTQDLVRHLDGSRTNNHWTNLCPGTHLENVRDMIEHGTHPSLDKARINNPSFLPPVPKEIPTTHNEPFPF